MNKKNTAEALGYTFLLALAIFCAVSLVKGMKEGISDSTSGVELSIGEVDHDGHTYLFIRFNNSAMNKSLVHSESCACKE
jgi:hypothetical protein